MADKAQMAALWAFLVRQHPIRLARQLADLRARRAELSAGTPRSRYETIESLDRHIGMFVSAFNMAGIRETGR